MRISTIITAYNTEQYVAQALDSVLAQTRPSDEIIVVDDGSTDGTSERLRNYATQTQIIRQQNFGVGHALNIGIGAATGDVLAFLDSDDLWTSDKLRIQCAALSGNDDL